MAGGTQGAMGEVAGGSKPQWRLLLVRENLLQNMAPKLMPEGSREVNQAKSREIMFQAQVTACAKFLGPRRSTANGRDWQTYSMAASSRPVKTDLGHTSQELQHTKAECSCLWL